MKVSLAVGWRGSLLLAVLWGIGSLPVHADGAGSDDAFHVVHDVIYGSAGGETLLADLYIPAGTATDGLRPAVLMVHGGGWYAGGRNSGRLVQIATGLARAGFFVASIDYRLVKDAADGDAIDNQFPAAIDDCREAVRWLRQNAAEYGIDPNRIGACGRSAGGHLVSLLVTTDSAEDGETSARVQAAVNIFGPADLTKPFPTIKLERFSVQDMVDRFVGKGNVDRQRQASPLFHIDERTGPVLIFHGTEDPLVPVDQARQFHAALQKAGRESELVIIEGEGHGFRPETQDKVLAQTVAFFDKHLRDGGSEDAGEKSAANSDRQDKPVDWLGIFQIHYDNRVRAFEEQNQLLQNVVLVGDSITEGFDVPTYLPGRRVLNRGIGGDVIGNALPESDKRGVLRRLDSSVLDCAPTHVFLMIGVNDLNSGRKPDVMEAGYRELLARIKQQAPRVKVYVQSLLPTSRQHAARNPDILDFNQRLQTLAEEFGYEYVDLHSLMADESGELKSEFTNDGLHLTPPGYRVWVKEIETRLGWNN